MKADRTISSNHWVQATPDCAMLFIVAQVPGAPDPARWVDAWSPRPTSR